jgi:hypothetical protein
MRQFSKYSVFIPNKRSIRTSSRRGVSCALSRFVKSVPCRDKRSERMSPKIISTPTPPRFGSPPEDWVARSRARSQCLLARGRQAYCFIRRAPDLRYPTAPLVQFEANLHGLA